MLSENKNTMFGEMISGDFLVSAIAARGCYCICVHEFGKMKLRYFTANETVYLPVPNWPQDPRNGWT